MRRVTCDAAFLFYGSVFISKRSLLISMALDAGGIRAGGQPGLFQFKTAMRIVTITALHGAFENLVVER